MQTAIQKIDTACSKYTEHEFVHASLLGVIGILTILACLGPAITKGV